MTDEPTLASICSQIVDCEHKSAPVDPQGEYFAVGTPAMRGNRIDFSAARRISQDSFLEWTRRLTPMGGDLLLAREAPVGPVVLVPNGGKVAPGQRTVLLRPQRELVEPGFLHALLSSAEVQRRLLEKSGGSTVAHLNVEDVRDLRLPVLPGLSAQRSIVRMLQAINDKVEANQVCTQASAARIIHSISAFPQVATLDTIAAQHKSAVDPSALSSPYVEHYSLPAFDAAHAPEIVLPINIKSVKFKIRQASVLVSKLNPRFPRLWDVPTVGLVPALASTEFLVLEPRYSSSTVLWAVVSQPAFTASLEAQVAGTSGSHQRVRPADLLATPVIDPRGLSEKVKALISTLGQSVASYRVESLQLAELRDTLLPELMSGRLLVNDAGRAVREVV